MWTEACVKFTLSFWRWTTVFSRHARPILKFNHACRTKTHIMKRTLAISTATPRKTPEKRDLYFTFKCVDLLSRLLGVFTAWRHQNTKLLILLRFYSHDVKEQLKTNMYTNVRSKWVLGFVIVFPWISKLLRDVVFTWRPKELSCWLKKVTYFDSSYIRKCIVSISSFEGRGSSRAKFTLL